jgi:hypothetical protein
VIKITFASDHESTLVQPSVRGLNPLIDPVSTSTNLQQFPEVLLVFPLLDLPAAERKLIETAITEKEGYVVTDRNYETLDAMIARFESHKELPNQLPSHWGMWLVRYDGKIYIAKVRHSR